MKENRKTFLISAAAGVVIAAAVVAIEWTRGYPLIHLLADGFFVAAVLLLGVGGIMAARNAGLFDIMGFSMKSLLGVVIPGARLADSHDNESLLEYKERKAESRKSPAPMLIAGGIHLAIAAVMLVIYTFTA